MDRQTVFDCIRKKYKMLPEYPWQKYDNNTVFRHTDNKKWFVLVMGVQRIKLCIAGDAYVDVVNLKIEDVLSGFDCRPTVIISCEGRGFKEQIGGGVIWPECDQGQRIAGCYQAGSEFKYNHQKGCGEQWKNLLQSRWQKTY